MENITLKILNTKGAEVDNVEVNQAILGKEEKTGVVWQAITAYMANRRKGLAATKTRGEVSGGGKKPWKQKGTGRARVGSTRSPLWRHGGVVFGPHPRDFSYTLPQKIRDAALKTALLSKFKASKVLVLEGFELEKFSTKEAVKVFDNLKITGKKLKDDSVLLLMDKVELNLRRALRNIAFLKVNLAKDTNVFEVLNADKIVITKNALADLTKRLKK